MINNRGILYSSTNLSQSALERPFQVSLKKKKKNIQFNSKCEFFFFDNLNENVKNYVFFCEL